MTVPRILMSSEGPEISRLVYGTARLLDHPDGASPERVLSLLQACLDVGITTFDHADIYGNYRSEEVFGAALSRDPSLRDRMQLITQCGVMLKDPARPKNRIKHYNYTQKHIVESVDRTLQNLKIERIDLLLLHRPSPMMDPDEVAGAFTELGWQGKVLNFGVSNFRPHQFDLLQSRLSVPLVTNQVQINPLHLDPFLDGTIDQCMKHKISTMAWSPTAGGRVFTGDSARAKRVRQILAALARKYRATLEQMVYAWILAHPAYIIPVLGTQSIARIQAAAKATEIAFDLQDWFTVWNASTGQELP